MSSKQSKKATKDVAKAVAQAVAYDSWVPFSETILFISALGFFVGTWYEFVFKTATSNSAAALNYELYLKDMPAIVNLTQWSLLTLFIGQAAFYGVFRYGMCLHNNGIIADVVHRSHAFLSRCAGTIGALNLVWAYVRCAYPEVHKQLLEHVLLHVSNNITQVNALHPALVELLIGVVPALVLVMSATVLPSLFDKLVELLQTLLILSMLGLSGFRSYQNVLEKTNNGADLNAFCKDFQAIQALFIASVNCKVFLGALCFIVRSAVKRVFIRRLLLIVATGLFFLSSRQCAIVSK